MLRKTLSIEHSLEQEQSLIKRMEFILNRWWTVDEWVMRLYRKGTLKRYLFACSQWELYIALERKILEQNRKWKTPESYESPKTSWLVRHNIRIIIAPPAANDSHLWAWIGEDTRRILEKYAIEPMDISIPLSQLDNLTWIYHLDPDANEMLSREDVLELIASIPEILKIQL